MPNKHKMPVYQGKKDVYASPMTLGDYNKLQGWTIPEDQDPNREGFLVEYKDGGKPNHPDYEGYISWSPADVFEGSYKLIETPLDRLEIEVSELDDKLGKLGAFIGSGKSVELGHLNAGLLAGQFDAMDIYSKITHLRKALMSKNAEFANYGNYKQPAIFTNVSWQMAQTFVALGFPILRAGWNGKGMFVSAKALPEVLAADKFWIEANKQAAIDNGGQIQVDPYFTLKTAQNTIQMGWIPSAGDLWANDWVILMPGN